MQNKESNNSTQNQTKVRINNSRPIKVNKNELIIPYAKNG